MRKLAERAAGHIAWRLLRVALKRLGIPPVLWPFIWLGRKIATRQLRKRGLTWEDVLKEVTEEIIRRKGSAPQ